MPTVLYLPYDFLFDVPVDCCMRLINNIDQMLEIIFRGEICGVVLGLYEQKWGGGGSLPIIRNASVSLIVQCTGVW